MAHRSTEDASGSSTYGQFDASISQATQGEPRVVKAGLGCAQAGSTLLSVEDQLERGRKRSRGLREDTQHHEVRMRGLHLGSRMTQKIPQAPKVQRRHFKNFLVRAANGLEQNGTCTIYARHLTHVLSQPTFQIPDSYVATFGEVLLTLGSMTETSLTRRASKASSRCLQAEPTSLESELTTNTLM